MYRSRASPRESFMPGWRQRWAARLTRYADDLSRGDVRLVNPGLRIKRNRCSWPSSPQPPACALPCEFRRLRLRRARVAREHHIEVRHAAVELEQDCLGLGFNDRKLGVFAGELPDRVHRLPAREYLQFGAIAAVAPEERNSEKPRNALQPRYNVLSKDTLICRCVRDRRTRAPRPKDGASAHWFGRDHGIHYHAYSLISGW